MVPTCTTRTRRAAAQAARSIAILMAGLASTPTTTVWNSSNCPAEHCSSLNSIIPGAPSIPMAANFPKNRRSRTGSDGTSVTGKATRSSSSPMVTTIVERYRRTSYGTLEVEMTVNDPKTYTAPIVAPKATVLLVPGAELWENFCVPSDYGQFNEHVFGNAAGTTKQ